MITLAGKELVSLAGGQINAGKFSYYGPILKRRDKYLVSVCYLIHALSIFFSPLSLINIKCLSLTDILVSFQRRLPIALVSL
jgi:hypothetical protein